MRLRLSLRAKFDIKRIYLNGARSFGVRQADTYQTGLLDTLKLIASNPLLAHERLGFSRPVRIHQYQSHLIAYSLDEQGVWVVRILHAHQNLRRIF